MGPVPKPVELIALRKLRVATDTVPRCYKLSDIAVCNYIWYHSTVSIIMSIYLSTVSLDLINMNATATALLGNIEREDTIDPSNIETPCAVNKNCHSFN